MISGKDAALHNLCKMVIGETIKNAPENYSRELWESIVKMADEEGLAGLLYYRIRSASDNPGGKDAMEELRSLYYQSVAKNVLFIDLADRLVEEFKFQNIPVMVLKGAALARWLYPHPGTRPMSDVDILVRPGDISRVLRICKTLEWTLEKITYHAIMVGGAHQNLLLEVHWTLPGGNTCPEWFFGIENRTTAQLMYLIAHLAIQHPGKYRLIWLYDIHLLLTKESEKIDWQLLESDFKMLGWGGILKGVLEQVNTCFATSLPELAVFSEEAGSLPSSSQHQWVYQAFSKLSWHLRLRCLAPFIFPSAKYMQWRYKPNPAWIWPVYYFYRWLSFKEMLTQHKR